MGALGMTEPEIQRERRIWKAEASLPCTRASQVDRERIAITRRFGGKLSPRLVGRPGELPSRSAQSRGNSTRPPGPSRGSATGPDRAAPPALFDTL
jgi:hypothetical protein